MLTELSGVLGAFQPDLDGLGVAARAAVLVFSEFGRRVAENATHGTDHGTAAALFIIGAAIRHGLDKRPHRRTGNKNPERCPPMD
jgi:uncharacterized protein (DUF1501 family)